MAGADFGSVPGNEELKRTLSLAIREGTLGHAYIIEGACGIGKHALAGDLAAAVLCTGSGSLPCSECPSCKRIAAGSHPDVRTVGRDGKASVGVDTVRRLRSDAHIIPSESERKVYIIEDADTMTVEAQNAFLLSLEEPPAYVLYLLLCRDSKALLETIRSRAASLRMRPCTRKVMEEYLVSVGGAKTSVMRTREPERWDELLVSAGGNPGRARALLEGNALTDRIEEKQHALALISAMLSGSDNVIVDIATMKKTKRDTALSTLSDIQTALRDMLLSKKTHAFDTCFFTSTEAADAAGRGFSARKLAAAIDAARECSAAIERNGAVVTSLLSMTIKIKNS